MSFPEGSVEGMFFSLPEGWEDIALGIMKEGGHMVQAHIAIGVCATDHEILMRITEYANVFINGMAECESWWFTKGVEGLHDKDFNNKLFDMMTKRMFNWDKKIDKLKDLDKDDSNVVTKGIEEFKNKYLTRVQ